MKKLNINSIYEGDTLKNLKKFPDRSVHCIVTSPPYWGLRNYGVDGQLGLEHTPKKYIMAMVRVFRECRRVLRDDGTLWLNIGDTYFGGKGANGASVAYAASDHVINRKALLKTAPGETRPNDRPQQGLKPKDMVGIPWMLAFALRADGWYLRQDIIWSKPNPMPESISDRCTKSHEYIFLFSKSKKYYFDAFAIATVYAEKTLTTFGCKSNGRGDGTGLVASENWGNSIKERKPKKWGVPAGWDTEPGNHTHIHRNGRSTKQETTDIPITGKANKRSVWTVPTEPFPEAHFATYPQKLVSDCILAGCPIEGIVLDPFYGTGTTGIVARKLGRNFVGIELKREYIEIAERRAKKELGLFI